MLKLEILVQEQVKIYIVEIEIEDINDNAPTFQVETAELKILESTATGSRFLLPDAQDPDLGRNSLQTYQLSPNGHFTVDVLTATNGGKYVELILDSALDREAAPFHDLILTASDGGDPVKSGTVHIRVVVEDMNDNAPIFSQSVYKVTVLENIPLDSLLVTVNATDMDEGINAEITYAFRQASEKALNIFHLDSKTGEVRVKENLDFEEDTMYEIEIQALDGRGLSGRAHVLVTVIDVNDNAPGIAVTSLTNAVSEDSPQGITVALLRVTDRDSDDNGKVWCSLSENLPFRLQKTLDNYYSLVTDKALDREIISTYNVTVIATDKGNPPLSTTTIIPLKILDKNDNPPTFRERSYITSITENTPAGTLVFTLKANDPDWEENSRITYSIIQDQLLKATEPGLFTIGLHTGEIKTARSFLEKDALKQILVILVKDNGQPPLSASITATVVLADSIPDILTDLSSISVPADPQTDLTFYLVVAVAFVSCLFFAFLLVLLALRLHKWRASQLCESGSMSFNGVPVSQFVGIDGVRAFLHSYCHEVSLTSGSRKSQVLFPIESCTNTLRAQQDSNNLEPFFAAEDPNINTEAFGQVSTKYNTEIELLQTFQEVKKDQMTTLPKSCLYRSAPTDDSTGVELAPRSSEPGYLVTKVVAVDADSAQNAWLSYQLVKATEPGLFTIGLHTGEIRTARFFVDKDALKQSLVVLVKDNGQPPLSASVTVTVVLADSIPDVITDLSSISAPEDPQSDLTFYLVVAVAFVSCLFFAFLLVLLALRLRRWRHSQLCDSGSVTFTGVPVSQFVGIDGVRAFLRSYCHELSLTSGSRKSQILFPIRLHKKILC
uniref:Uncharacterized protein n=1 Tax=Sphaerodactylus townsendi TaxID=933632 RepID=A0ACB8EBL5_9SAUR